MNAKRSIKKNLVIVAGVLIFIMNTPAFAEVEIKPYGAAQYRFRGQFNTITPRDVTVTNDDGEIITQEIDNFTTFDYNNTMSWRIGARVGVDERLSLQFQIGNDWSPGDNVSWTMNNTPRARLGNQQNLYVHLASARLNLGYMFLEGGVVPFNSNGTLDLLESSLSNGWYGDAGVNSWSHANNSILGFRVGAAIVDDDVKIRAELLQSIVRGRQQATVRQADGSEPAANPPAILMVLTVPVEAGALRIAPEITSVINRNYSTVEGKGDHEIIVGASSSYRVNDMLSVNLSGGYGMLDNTESKTSAYNRPFAQSPDTITYSPSRARGLLVSAGATLRNVGPGNVIVAVNYNNTVNDYNQATRDATDTDIVDADFRYVYRIHKNYTITSRYRFYYYDFPNNNANESRINNRFEFLFEGSF